MNFGVVVFPGTWSDCYFHYVIGEVLHQPVRYVWHRDSQLADSGVVLTQDGEHLLWLRALREGGEAADIREEGRDLTAMPG